MTPVYKAYILYIQIRKKTYNLTLTPPSTLYVYRKKHIESLFPLFFVYNPHPIPGSPTHLIPGRLHSHGFPSDSDDSDASAASSYGSSGSSTSKRSQLGSFTTMDLAKALETWEKTWKNQKGVGIFGVFLEKMGKMLQFFCCKALETWEV